MKPFRAYEGLAVPLLRENIDTDQILPKQFLKRIERTGFGEFLFHDWAKTPSGDLNPEFELNHSSHRGASILITGANFGCGSSREHAPWALLDYGFRVIIAPSFADIFAINCFKNGLLTVVLSEREVQELARRASTQQGYQLQVDLEGCSVSDRAGFATSFEVDEFRRHCLLNGLDEIGLTLQHEDAIAAYENLTEATPGLLG